MFDMADLLAFRPYAAEALVVQDGDAETGVVLDLVPDRLGRTERVAGHHRGHPTGRERRHHGDRDGQ